MKIRFGSFLEMATRYGAEVESVADVSDPFATQDRLDSSAEQVADGLAVEQHARRALGKVVFDLGVTRDEREVALVFEVGFTAQRGDPDRPVHRTGVEKIKPQTLRQRLRHCRFARPCRAVDRDHHRR